VDMDHKLLDYAQHLGVYIGGIFTVISAGIGLWFYDRKETKKEIKEVRIIALHLREHMATREDLKECSESKDEQADKHLDLVLNEVKDLRTEIKEDSRINNDEHTAIMNKMLELHAK
jgi:hypothetical protein